MLLTGSQFFERKRKRRKRLSKERNTKYVGRKELEVD